MNLVTNNIKWIMLVFGLVTCTLFAALFAPTWTIAAIFGENLSGAANIIVVRNWGALVGLVGVFLVCGAFDSTLRKPALILAVVSKILFVVLLLFYGSQYYSKVALTVLFDMLGVILFTIYLASEKSVQRD